MIRPHVRLPRALAVLFVAGTLAACAQPDPPPAPSQTGGPAPSPLNRTVLFSDVQYLSSDGLQGRLTGSPGNRIARDFIARRFADLGLTPVDSEYTHPFPIQRSDGSHLEAANVLARIPGSDSLAPTIAVTAHFDHLGVRNGEVYNGADDNASGIGTLLALAAYFVENPLRHALLIAALDAEEIGLRGAHALLQTPAVDTASLRMNVNLDMIGRSDRGELYVSGTYHAPVLVPVMKRVAQTAPVTLLLGHDRPDLPRGDDWTSQSDHFIFHRAGIPFLYFGVENHADYHGPGDDFELLHLDFFFGAAETIRLALIELDRLPGSARP